MYGRRFLQAAILILILLLLVGGYTLFFGFPQLQAGSEEQEVIPIGFVDIQAVFQQHPKKIQVEELLNQEARAMQEELEKKIKDLNAQERQHLIEDYQLRIVQREEELIHTVVEAIDNSILEVAQEKNVAMVLEKHNVIYGGKDLTPMVIRRTQEVEGDHE